MANRKSHKLIDFGRP